MKMSSQEAMVASLQPFVELLTDMLFDRFEKTSVSNTVWLTSAEAADALGISPSRLNQWRSTCRPGQPQFHKTGSLVRYRRSVIEAWIEENSVNY